MKTGLALMDFVECELQTNVVYDGRFIVDLFSYVRYLEDRKTFFCLTRINGTAEESLVCELAVLISF